MFAGEISTEIAIEGSPEQVWAVFSDFERWGEWNPFIKEIKVIGTDQSVKQGAKLKCSMYLNEKPATFTPTVTVWSPQKELKWRGSLPIPGLFTGEHYFRFESAPSNVVKLYHGEHFSGLLVPVLSWVGILKKTTDAFIAMNEALKRRVEGER